MKTDAALAIHSFIVRFVVEEAPPVDGLQVVYHGAIRHIQSAEELHFNEWGDAVEFMRRYVPIEETNSES